MKARRYFRTEPYLRSLTALAGKRYAVGPYLEDAATLSGELHSSGYSNSIAYWNRPGESEAAIVRQNLLAIERITDPSDYLSVKAPSFKARPEPAASIINHAAAQRVSLHFDSHGIEHTDRLLKLVELAHQLDVEAGLSVPARWHRSEQDLETLAKLNATPRIIKGQWADPNGPELDPGERFLDLVDIAAGTASRVRLATHDPELLDEAIRRLADRDIRIEIEFLYAVPMFSALEVARQHHLPIRIYLPYGMGFVPYAMGKLMGNPALAVRLLRDILDSGTVRFPQLQ